MSQVRLQGATSRSLYLYLALHHKKLIITLSLPLPAPSPRKRKGNALQNTLGNKVERFTMSILMTYITKLSKIMIHIKHQNRNISH